MATESEFEWKELPTNYTDAVWSGPKKYQKTTESIEDKDAIEFTFDGEEEKLTFKDVTEYEAKDNSFFTARDANLMNRAMNYIMEAITKNGNDESLYNVFHEWVEAQRALCFALMEKFAQETADSAQKAETAAINAESARDDAEGYAEDAVEAQTAAENAKASAEAAAKDSAAAKTKAEEILAENQQVAVNTPYIDENGYWCTWDKETGDFKCTNNPAKGDKGEKGEKGDKGDQGISGVTVAAAGVFAFYVSDSTDTTHGEGHLMLAYEGDEQPNFSLNNEGHLIYTVEETEVSA